MMRNLGFRSTGSSTSLAVAACALLGAMNTFSVDARAFVVTTSANFATQDATKDVVNMKNGQTELGKVKVADFNGIEIDPAKGASKRIPWTEIAPNGVVYANAQWQAVMDNLAVSKFADAMPGLMELKGDTKLPDPLRQNVLYFLGVAHQQLGQADEALAAYKELTTAFPKSQYLMDVGDAIVTIYSAKKDYAGAVKALSDLDIAAAEASFSASVGVLKGRVFEEQQDWAKAGGAYDVASRATGIPPTVQLQAELGLARTLAAQNKKTEAETALTKLKSKEGPNHLMAGIWNGLGDLMLERGRSGNGGKGDADQLLDALYMYLRGVVQYAPLPGQPTREYERALDGSARAFRALGEVETVADRKRLYQQRAAQRVEQLKREFPNSPFANG